MAPFPLQGLPFEKVHCGEAHGEGRDSSGRDVQQVSPSQKAVPGRTGMLLGAGAGGVFSSVSQSPANRSV